MGNIISLSYPLTQMVYAGSAYTHRGTSNLRSSSAESCSKHVNPVYLVILSLGKTLSFFLFFSLIFLKNNSSKMALDHTKLV